MEDDKLLLASFADKQSLCTGNCMITYTRFLDLRQQSLFLSFPADRDAVSFLFGGFPEAERKIGIFIPKIYGVENPGAYLDYDGGKPLEAIRIDKDKFSSLSHRDYLGALMNLGIKRETVGDIIVDEKGAFVIAFEEVCPYLIENLSRIGRGSCKVRETELSEIKASAIKTEEKSVTLASLRLDNVVAAAFSISRRNAAECISQKKVFVDGLLCEKPDKILSSGTKIVLHGKGRAVLSEQIGVSRRDRPKIIIKRYI